jgi:hypothetical protein
MEILIKPVLKFVNEWNQKIIQTPNNPFLGKISLLCV